MKKTVTKKEGIGFFEKYLTLWVVACMVIGVLIGKYVSFIPEFLNRFEYAQISIPIAILIWVMIYPMMMKVDFQSIKDVRKNPKGLFVTWVTNWLIKPFTMFGVAYLFFFVIFSEFITPDLAKDYLAGAVLLGAAPCTAMVFVWSHLTKGNPAYTVVQVATNDLIILIAFIPIVKFLLGVSDISVPWDTLILSVLLFVVVPLVAGVLTRYFMVKSKGKEYFEKTFIPKFSNTTIVGLLLTLIIIFSFQGEVILNNPIHILLIAIPLTIQTFFIFFIAYFASRVLKLPHDIAAPAGMIGASNFFELSVAVAIALFGTSSPVALATIVGVLTEVPVMLMLVKIANKTKHWFVYDKEQKKELKMKKMEIFEPALCCETGVCGVGVDPELLRISSAVNILKSKDVTIYRHNLNSEPMEFINNTFVNTYVRHKGVEGLPVVLVDNVVVIEGRYPTNEELLSYLGLSEEYLEEVAGTKLNEDAEKASNGCCDSGKCC